MELLFPPPQVHEPPIKGKGKGWPALLKGILKQFPKVYQALKAVKEHWDFRDLLDRFTLSQVEEMKRSRVLVFHEWWLAHAYLEKVGRQEGQKVLLMSHSPVEWAREYADTLKSYAGPSLLWEVVYGLYAKKELRTWSSCDGLVAPSRHSLEGYFPGNGRKRIRELRVLELPTGVQELVPKRPLEEVRRTWGLPQEAMVLGFFGRRHPHKGYDIFYRLALLALGRMPELVFVSAGNGPLAPPPVPNLRHLGFLAGEELADAINACDLILVPNRVTYFDLVILEAMSLGKPVITTRIGGARSILAPGVYLVDHAQLGPEELLRLVAHLAQRREALSEAGRENRRVYEERYSLKAFARRHCQAAEALLEWARGGSCPDPFVSFTLSQA
ncbi:glycosyltransferase [uncultured Thermus sp.]|uniref:glycosyltransferase family 4 protein n=1 Tax=uncultured Thermus sp. TaxID=157149 RepID=UPI00260E8A01|nr:glycosyltransferase [uncultured Thermus sp.]